MPIDMPSVRHFDCHSLWLETLGQSSTLLGLLMRLIGMYRLRCATSHGHRSGRKRTLYRLCPVGGSGR